MRAIKGNTGLLLIAFVTMFALSDLFSSSTQALFINTPRDCDNNAVLRCGAETPGQLQYKYNKQSGAAAIFGHFGISSTDIQNIGSTAVSGLVTRDGRVVVDGKTVATGAMTAGRQFMPGSQAVRSGGTKFYVRPPSVSFVSSPLAAFVVMNGGQFRFAILASCGNPVVAQAVKKQQAIAPARVVKHPHRQRPAPAPTPANVNNNTNINNNNVNVQVNNQQQQQQQSAPVPTRQKQVATVAPAPAQAQAQTQAAPAAQQPATTPSAAAAPALPNTGPGDVFTLAGLTTIIGTLGHLFFTRKSSWFIIHH